MEEVTLAGIDLGKHSFHSPAQGRKGKEGFRRKVTRRRLVELLANFPACTIAMEGFVNLSRLRRKDGRK